MPHARGMIQNRIVHSDLGVFPVAVVNDLKPSALQDGKINVVHGSGSWWTRTVWCITLIKASGLHYNIVEKEKENWSHEKLCWMASHKDKPHSQCLEMSDVRITSHEASVLKGLSP